MKGFTEKTLVEDYIVKRLEEKAGNLSKPMSSRGRVMRNPCLFPIWLGL